MLYYIVRETSRPLFRAGTPAPRSAERVQGVRGRNSNTGDGCIEIGAENKVSDRNAISPIGVEPRPLGISMEPQSRLYLSISDCTFPIHNLGPLADDTSSRDDANGHMRKAPERTGKKKSTQFRPCSRPLWPSTDLKL